MDARQRRIAQFARRLVVSRSDHGRLVGHDDADPPARFQHALRPRIAASHDGHRLGQTADPAGQAILVHLPGRLGMAGDRQFVHRAIAARRSDRGYKGFAGLARPECAADTAVAEVPESAIQQMVGCHAGNGPVVGVDQRDSRRRRRPQGVDHRQAGPADRGSDSLVRQPGDNAVALPCFEPCRRSGLHPTGFIVDRPGPVLLHVLSDAAQDSAAWLERGFHQQRNVTRAVSRATLS